MNVSQLTVKKIKSLSNKDKFEIINFIFRHKTKYDDMFDFFEDIECKTCIIENDIDESLLVFFKENNKDKRLGIGFNNSISEVLEYLSH